MVRVQINLDEIENKIVDVYRAMKGLKSKEQAIKEIIKEQKTKLKL